MAELEKVIKGLECCILRDPDDHARCSQCSYDGNCVNRLKMDALSLLKAQKPGWISVKDRMPDEQKNLPEPCNSEERYGIIYAKVEARKNIRELPSVPAVPLDKLCLLLHDIAGSPCYAQPGEDMCNHLIGDQCNPEWDDVECWKQFLTKWMEEQDADRQRKSDCPD